MWVEQGSTKGSWAGQLGSDGEHSPRPSCPRTAEIQPQNREEGHGELWAAPQSQGEDGDTLWSFCPGASAVTIKELMLAAPSSSTEMFHPHPVNPGVT